MGRTIWSTIESSARPAAAPRAAFTSLTEPPTTVVHGDFHHRNFLAERGRITGVFDWDIGGPGDWRFDLVNLAFACQMYPKTCAPEALARVTEAVREHCDAPTATMLTAVQIVRSLSMLRARRRDWVEPASRRMQSVLTQWRM